MKGPKNPKLLQFILDGLNKNGGIVKQGKGRSHSSEVVGSRRTNLQLGPKKK